MDSEDFAAVIVGLFTLAVIVFACVVVVHFVIKFW
jgi:hypothetical protein